VAVPTASPETCEELKAEVDEVVCAITPEPFYAVGYWYDNFTQTTDQEVRELLARGRQPDWNAYPLIFREHRQAECDIPQGSLRTRRRREPDSNHRFRCVRRS
jgi:hypothetical protein